MSDLGLLSHQYQIKADFARRLRLNVLRIKRQYYGLTLLEDNTEADTRASVSEMLIIVEFLQDILSLNEKDVWPVKWLDDPPLPNALVEQLKRLHILERPGYIKGLTRLGEHLQQDITALRDKDIFLLEEIAHSANVDANTVFRKLMRWA